MLTTLLRLCGQRSTGPSGVALQSRVRMRSPSSPPPASQPSERRGAWVESMPADSVSHPHLGVRPEDFTRVAVGIARTLSWPATVWILSIVEAAVEDGGAAESAPRKERVIGDVADPDPAVAAV